MSQMRSCDAIMALRIAQPTREDEEEIGVLNVRLFTLESNDALSCPCCQDVKVFV
jgi:hypothetical protein